MTPPILLKRSAVAALSAWHPGSPSRPPNERYHRLMATFRISESEATRDFAAVLARVRAGEEIVIERDTSPIAVVLPAPGEGPGRLLSESIAAAEARGSTP
jgi:antitoxin (DNA-binding transcriptional repressor) of toxin-antitoxin stability system